MQKLKWNDSSWHLFNWIIKRIWETILMFLQKLFIWVFILFIFILSTDELSRWVSNFTYFYLQSDRKPTLCSNYNKKICLAYILWLIIQLLCTYIPLWHAVMAQSQAFINQAPTIKRHNLTTEQQLQTCLHIIISVWM